MLTLLRTNRHFSISGCLLVSAIGAALVAGGFTVAFRSIGVEVGMRVIGPPWLSRIPFSFRRYGGRVALGSLALGSAYRGPARSRRAAQRPQPSASCRRSDGPPGPLAQVNGPAASRVEARAC